LPNALAPIVNVVALNLAYLVVGVVVVEVVFVYPGLGQLLVDSVAKRDIPVVQACSLIFAAPTSCSIPAPMCCRLPATHADASKGVDHEPA
jgi:ABC-type dipeptide/oligopeptide/nickel transport system permease component